MTAASTRPETAYERSVRRAREQFARETTDHEMTVLRDDLDDGIPYRHLRFARPGTGIWSFELVTWPGHLAISGDLESYTFRRLHDMVAFFGGRGGVNPSYWAEKIVAGAHGTEYGKTRYSDEEYVQIVRDRLAEWRGDYDDADFASLEQYVQAELLDEIPLCVEHAHERLTDFEWDPADGVDRDGWAPTARFSDVWEYDFRGYDHHFLLSIHAVRWGVHRYLAEHPGRFIPEGAERG